ncbi:MAG: hypothetical protein ACM3NF_04525 [Gemmatimonadota bacterium]
MKPAFGACILCLLLIVGAAPAYPSGDSSGWVVAMAEKPAENLAGNLEKVDFQPYCKCSDIAHTGVFRANRLQYVRTPEFARAVRILASGESRYSPRVSRDLPLATWKMFADELGRHSDIDAGDALGAAPSALPLNVRTGSGEMCFLRVEERMIPALMYLASLEYRSWPGHADVMPVFPRYFRAATSELDARMTQKREMAGMFARRAAAIRARIAEAERRGTRTCSAEELARAKSELDRAYRDALGARTSLQEADVAFARAEKVADGLLAR